jgi:hypothetical protein
MHIHQYVIEQLKGHDVNRRSKSVELGCVRQHEHNRDPQRDHRAKTDATMGT